MIQSEETVIERMPRATVIDLLIERDGTTCQYPDCGNELKFDIVNDDSPQFVTIDHWIPKHYGLAQGWSWERIWDLDNLKLMEKKCNAKKGDRVPNADNTLPARAVKTFRSRREKRIGRPEICMACSAGRDLGKDEICATCQHGAAPLRFPRWAKVSSAECDHEMFWCWACSIGITPRASAEEMIYLWGEGGV